MNTLERREYNKAYREKNKERLNENNRKYHKKYYQENAEKIRERFSKWREENLEKAKKLCKKWKEENKEKIAVHERKFAKNHPEYVCAKSQRRRARKLGNGGSFTAKEWSDLVSKYEGKCLCCKEVKPLAADHVIPLVKGGANSIDNIQPLCKICNSKKGTKTIDYRTISESP